MIEKTYRVEGMSCDHCKAAIEDSLNELSGIERANADPDRRTVEFAYDESRADEAKIKGAIKDAGYTLRS